MVFFGLSRLMKGKYKAKPAQTTVEKGTLFELLTLKTLAVVGFSLKRNGGAGIYYPISQSRRYGD